MALLAGICTSHKLPAYPIKQHRRDLRLVASLPYMASLWPAYLMRHGTILTRLVFSNEKACLHYDSFGQSSFYLHALYNTSFILFHQFKFTETRVILTV